MKDHHFKDDNGKEITPIGPTAWEATIALNSTTTSYGLDSQMRNFKQRKKIVHESQLIIHSKE